MSTVNLIAYLMINAFHIYIFFLAYRVFLGPPRVNEKIEFVCYALFYAVNSGAFILIGNPFLNLSTSIAPLFLLTVLYTGNGRTRILIGIFTYIASMLFESISLGVTQLLGMSITAGTQTLGNLMANLLLFVAVLIYKKARQETKQRALNLTHWVTIIALPVGSLVIVALLYNVAVHTVITLVVSTILIVINILVFYLYDRLDQYYFSSFERHRLQQQRDAYMHELEIIKTSNHNIQMLRHDLKNYLFTAGKLLDLKKYDELKELISGVNGTYLSTDTFVDTGNPELDSILNIKLYEASQLGATLEIDVKVPYQLPITAADLSVILGNLLDNAVEAMKESAIKNLKVHIYVDRGMLVLQMSNTFSGERKKERVGETVSYKTKKPQPELHGLGLQSVKRAVEKYDGDMTISDTDGLFRVNIIMYLP